MKKLQRIILVCVILTTAISIHEAGHYTALRFFGVTVEEVALGFGPTLLTYHADDGTNWMLKPILIGAFVKPCATGDRSIQTLSALQRTIVESAGIVFGILTAFLICLFAPRKISVDANLHGLRSRIGFAFTESMVLTVRIPFSIVRDLRHPKTLLQNSAGPVGIVRLYDGNRVRLFYMCSVGVASFNCLPVFPLDGGRMLSHLILYWFGETAHLLYITLGLVLVNMFIVFSLIADFTANKRSLP